MKYLSAAIICLWLSPAAAGQVRSRHPIDRALDKCLSVKRGTMPRAECYGKAFESWDADVTKTFLALKKALTGERETTLERSEADWERYRDSEFEFIAAQYAGKKGSGYIAARIISRIEIVKPRALLLEQRLQDLVPSK